MKANLHTVDYQLLLKIVTLKMAKNYFPSAKWTNYQSTSNLVP